MTDIARSRRLHLSWALSLTLLLTLTMQPATAIEVRDDAGNSITLSAPAQRIVTLAPHATELVFAAGAGERIVGTVSYSDYPAAARSIPRIGSNSQIDIERLIALKPDLLVVWLHGNATRQLEKLRSLGIPLFYSEPQHLSDIPDAVERLGRLAGTETQARASAAALRAQLAALSAQYRARPPVRLFYQVWPHPLYTLNGKHIVSDAIRLCGGVNIFANLSATAPIVGVEAVLLENPEVVISGDLKRKNEDGNEDEKEGELALWRTYPALLAVQRDNLFALDGDLLSRPGPRMIEGTAALCKSLETARAHRTAAVPETKTGPFPGAH
ncbi:MAG: putative Cobalamin binding protein BtuF [Herbaspirillum sp.]|nr:putative Cobalamin binding protein BtuF [Herbaspirillum sp.]